MLEKKGAGKKRHNVVGGNVGSQPKVWFRKKGRSRTTGNKHIAVQVYWGGKGRKSALGNAN